ncbi:MAG: hypothetical protein HOV66_20515 [Streptomycetaceae bacterium]|jgi:hypothetical protein|nr:hypothetical protein [Streptomycetaceae bacterium]
MPRRAAIKAVVPLTAIALVGLTACQKSDDDAKSTPSASVSADAGKNDANATPPSDDQLSAVLLDGKDIPAGFNGGKVKNDRSDTSGETAAPAECGVLAGIGSPDPVGHAERSYATGGNDPESDDSIRVSMSSAPRDQLKKQLDDAVKALKTCTVYTVSQGADAITFTVSDVKTAPYGKDSLSYRVTVADASQRAMGTAVNTLVLKGATGLAVTSFASPGKGDPADGAAFVKAQSAKLDAMPKGSGSPSAKPKTPTAKPSSSAASGNKNQPSTDALTAALLTKQEIEADYSADEAPSTERPTDSGLVVSDPKCARITDDSVGRSSTGYVDQTYRKMPAAGGAPTEAVMITLASQSHPFLKQEFDGYVTALKACTSFSATKIDGSVDRYTITDVTVGNYGTDSVAYRVRDDSKDGRAYMFIVVSIQGTVSTQVISVSATGPAAEPTNMITGQLDKVAALTR